MTHISLQIFRIMEFASGFFLDLLSYKLFINPTFKRRPLSNLASDKWQLNNDVGRGNLVK